MVDALTPDEQLRWDAFAHEATTHSRAMEDLTLYFDGNADVLQRNMRLIRICYRVGNYVWVRAVATGDQGVNQMVRMLNVEVTQASPGKLAFVAKWVQH